MDFPSNLVPARAAALFQRVQRAVGGEAARGRHGEWVLQWPGQDTSERPIELSLEFETRLAPSAPGEGLRLLATLHRCEGGTLTPLLGLAWSEWSLKHQAEGRPTGAQSIDVYHDNPGGQTGLIAQGFTIRERTDTSGHMLWQSTDPALRPLNMEILAIPIGIHGLIARLEFNWLGRLADQDRDRHNPRSPWYWLDDLCSQDTGPLHPVIRHTTVRRKFELCRSDHAPIVLNVDLIFCESLACTSASTFYCDVDLSPTTLLTSDQLQTLDVLAETLRSRFGLAPIGNTKVANDLRHLSAEGREEPA